MESSDLVASKLCLNCGLCCNGVLFKDVRLQAGDDAERLRACGLKVSSPTPGAKRGSLNKPEPRFPQPCAALGADLRCSIYTERPTRCREFECLLFKDVLQGALQLERALKVVRDAQRRVKKVLGLMAPLEEKPRNDALSVRFRKVQRHMERASLTEDEADLYGQLTLAVHDLNVLLSSAFYR